MNQEQSNVPICRNGKNSPFSFNADDYRGEGASESLSRGILVFSGDRNLTGEGMGIGSIAFRKQGFTYFSSRHTTTIAGEAHTEKVFLVDTWRRWSIGGYSSTGLTRIIEWTADCYMALPWIQPVLGIQSPLIRALSLHPSLEHVSPLGRARFWYSFAGQDIQVSCRIESCSGDLPRVFILNELDGEVFCRSFLQGRSRAPPSGWRCCPDHACLTSRDGDISFSLVNISVDGADAWKVFWGREQTETLRWAGFEIMIDPGTGIRRIDCSYTVRFGRCTGQEGA